VWLRNLFSGSWFSWFSVFNSCGGTGVRSVKRPMQRQELAEQLDVSASLVSRYAKRGMPTDSVERAKRWIARNVRARVAERSTPAAPNGHDPEAAETVSEQLPIEPPEANDEREGASDTPEGTVAGDPKYQTSRADREEASARREWLRLLEDEGKLIRIDQIQAELAARLAPVREAFMQLPARIAPLVAAENDAAKIQNQLETEIHAILARLADR
jgi:hypothetical protein